MAGFMGQHEFRSSRALSIRLSFGTTACTKYYRQLNSQNHGYCAGHFIIAQVAIFPLPGLDRARDRKTAPVVTRRNISN